MPLNYQGTEKIGNLDVWSFADESGAPFKTDDAALALELGAPVGQEAPVVPDVTGAVSPLGQQIQAPAPIADPRLALGMAGSVPTGTGSVADVGPTPPVMNPAAGIVGGGAPAPAMSMAPEESIQSSAPAGPAAPDTSSLVGPNGEELDFGEGEQAAPQQAGRSVPTPQGRDYLTAGVQAGVLPPPPPRYVFDPGAPGGWIDQSRSFKGDPARVESMQAKSRAITDSQVASTVARTDLETERLETERVDLMTERVRKEEDIAAQNALIEEREQYKRAERQNLANQRQEIAGRKVDPRRMFRDDPLATFVAAIAIGAGQFGAGIAGGPNMAAQMIDNAIQRDIDEQQGDIDRAYLDNEKAENALQRELDEGADPRFARQRLEILQNEYALVQLKSKEVQQQLASIGVNAADVINELELKQLDREAAFEATLGMQATQKYSAPRAAGLRENRNYDEDLGKWLQNAKGMAELTGIKPLDAAIVKEYEAMASGQASERSLFWRGKQVGQALSAKEGQDLRKQFGDSEAMLYSIDEVVRLADSWSSMSPQDRAEAEARITNLKMGAKGEALYQLGVLAGPDMEVLEGVIQNPNEFFSSEGNAKKRLEVLRETLLTKANKSLQSQGNQATLTWGN